MQSLIILPAMSLPLTLTGIHSTEIASNVLVQKINIETSRTLAIKKAADLEADTLKAKADAIDAYFAKGGMPLKGTGMKMVQEAEKNGIDWRLLPAISVRESTGGKHDCSKDSHNAFGWGSCKIEFKSDDIAIETVARNLGGNNPHTASYYDNKTTLQILHAYNPPSIVPKYAEQVMSIMNAIGNADEIVFANS